jgi:hypothetical protein
MLRPAVPVHHRIHAFVPGLDRVESRPMTTLTRHGQFDRRIRCSLPLRWLLLLGICVLATGAGALADARAEIFKARLSPLGVTNATVDTTTGIGSATATLSGTRLTIEAAFEGLTGAATAANVRRGAKGIPGPVVFELEVPTASSGKINATLDLTAEQIADLRAARLYLQIHSERAQDGSIRGWLLSAPR